MEPIPHTTLIVPCAVCATSTLTNTWLWSHQYSLFQRCTPVLSWKRLCKKTTRSRLTSPTANLSRCHFHFQSNNPNHSSHARKNAARTPGTNSNIWWSNPAFYLHIGSVLASKRDSGYICTVPLPIRECFVETFRDDRPKAIPNFTPWTMWWWMKWILQHRTPCSIIHSTYVPQDLLLACNMLLYLLNHGRNMTPKACCVWVNCIVRLTNGHRFWENVSESLRLLQHGVNGFCSGEFSDAWSSQIPV